jgi:saccharopine dehydrogenase (NAD+, L-lysine forming)
MDMKTLLIRAEDKNEWERRAPIVPDDLVQILRKTGARAYVEKSKKRFYQEGEYAAAGAEICEGGCMADVVMGVKEIPVEKIFPGKTYVFFSHTIKGQKANMPLLKKIIDSGATLIDYEKITDKSGKRLVYFGPFAGDAGTIDILSLMGEYWRHKGLKTPFAACKRAHEYMSVAHAKSHIAEIGMELTKKGLPPSLSPMVVGILGYGNVASGARNILESLPHQYVEPDSLIDYLGSGKADPKTVVISIFKEKDLVQRKDGAPFDLAEYHARPELYQSSVSPVLRHITILVNAVYWESRYPRFVTWKDVEEIYKTEANPKLQGIADISCDTNGSVELNVKSTDSNQPAYLCDPIHHTTEDGHLGEGIVLLAVDNLPCEVPKDSSDFFSRLMAPLVSNLLSADFSSSLEASGLKPELQKAVIVYKGSLNPAYSYLNDHLPKD